MINKKLNFLEIYMDKRLEEAKKGIILQKDVKTFQEIEKLKEEIDTIVEVVVKQNISPITVRLDQIYELLVKIGLKVDISAKEEEVLDLLKKELAKKE